MVERVKKKEWPKDYEELIELMELRQREVGLISRLLILAGAMGMSFQPEDVTLFGVWLMHNYKDREKDLAKGKEG